MGESVILPSLTDQMVLGIFKYLVDAELRKNISDQLEFRQGCQDGMMAAIVLMFGETDSVTSEMAYNQGKTWTHIIGEIKDDLQTWADTLENYNPSTDEDIDDIDFADLQNAVDKAVNDYVLKHPKKIGDALRVNL